VPSAKHEARETLPDPLVSSGQELFLQTMTDPFSEFDDPLEK